MDLDHQLDRYLALLDQLWFEEDTARGEDRAYLALRAGAIAGFLRRKIWRTTRQSLLGNALVARAELLEQICLMSEPGSSPDPR